MQLSKATRKSSDCIRMCYMKNTTMRSNQQLQTRWIRKPNITFQSVINFYKQLCSTTRIVPDNSGLFLLLFVSRYGCYWVLPICLSFQKAKSFRIHTQTQTKNRHKKKHRQRDTERERKRGAWFWGGVDMAVKGWWCIKSLQVEEWWWVQQQCCNLGLQ